MKNLLLLTFAGLCFSAFAAYEDDAEVQAFVAAGQPTIDWKSDKCPGQFSRDDKAIHKLGQERNYLCVNHVAIPRTVEAEIQQMTYDQLDNDSDYDQRITKVYVFESQLFKPQNINSFLLNKLRRAFNIPDSMARDLSVKTGKMSKSNISSFGGLAIGNDWQDDWDKESETFLFLKKQILGKNATQIVFENGKALYPGGGIHVTFHLFFFEGKVIYIKHVGWDA